MSHTEIIFAGDRVALIVRGKQNDRHAPGKLEQHADCIRSNGAPIGYFGEGGEGSGYLTSATLVGIRGEVYDMEGFRQNRPYYVDAALARTYNVISTVLVIQVDRQQAELFDRYWDTLTADPGQFRLLGKNCSTRASGAFRHAGILSAGIPGLDSPDNLYRQLKTEIAHRCTSLSGYVGFAALGNGMALRIETP